MSIKKNLDAIIYDKIKDSLISGTYLPGQKVYIDELADQYGVSRTPVIQAVKRLEAEKVLINGSNGRVTVPKYSEKEIGDICAARLLLEKFAIEHVCAQRNVALIDRMEQLADESRRAFEAGDYVTSCKKDILFHRCLVDGADNACVNDIFSVVQGRFLVVSYLSLTAKNRKQGKASSGHFELVEQMRRFDAAAACATAERHILSVYGQIVDARRVDGEFPE